MSEISPFVRFFDKKQQNKDDVATIKNVTFSKNCACRLVLYGVFTQFSSKISPLVFFNLLEKSHLLFYFLTNNNQKKDDLPPIKRYIL